MNEVSMYEIKVTFVNIASYRFSLRRIYAPLTIGELISKLPFKGKAIFLQKKYISIPLRLRVGVEKGQLMLKKGTIGYWPMSSSLVICLEDSKFYSPVNVLGHAIDDISSLREKFKSGTAVVIEKI
ncbi:MAG: cyclophilin-like family protein [Candidatus Asgardarchaeia archaeon]